MAAVRASGMSLLLLVFLVLEITDYASAARTCFMSIRLITKRGSRQRDFPDAVIRKFLGGCRWATSECPGRISSHFTAHLGGKVNPFDRKSATKVCELFGEQVTPQDNGEIFGIWKASSCDTNGEYSMGDICCWKYTIGSHTIMVPNMGCRETTRPTVS